MMTQWTSSLSCLAIFSLFGCSPESSSRVAQAGSTGGSSGSASSSSPASSSTALLQGVAPSLVLAAFREAFCTHEESCRSLDGARFTSFAACMAHFARQDYFAKTLGGQTLSEGYDQHFERASDDAVLRCSERVAETACGEDALRVCDALLVPHSAPSLAGC
jgi:hypothetical protein